MNNPGIPMPHGFGSGGSAIASMGAASRISCVEFLRSRANEYRRRADGLERLAGVLPSNLASLDPVADNELWTLIAALRVY